MSTCKKTAEKSPMLSIIMPVYNVGPYLDACLLSVRYQTFTDFELIIINDASEDNSLEIIEMHAALDKRIRIINLEHNTLGGAGIPSNIGLDVAIGTYIGFVDSDDWVKEDAFEKMITAAEKHTADIVIGDFCTFNDQDRSFSLSYDLKIFNQIPVDTAFTSVDFTNVFQLSPVPWRKLYRRSFLDKNNIRYPEGDYFYEDNPLHWFVLASQPIIVKINNVIAYHRMARNNQTMNSSDFKLGAMCCHINTISNFLHDKPETDNNNLFIKEFYTLCYKLNWFLNRQTRTDVKKIIGKQFSKAATKNQTRHTDSILPGFEERFNKLNSDYLDIDLSIVIPTYNSEDFIEETIKSVLKIKKISLNILIIDDGSSDQTENICRKLEKENKNIHFFMQKNKGAGRARNALIPLCTGRYTFFLDADDFVNATALEDSVIKATNSNYDLYFMKYQTLLNDSNKTIEMYNSDKEIWDKFTKTKDNNQLRKYASMLINYPWNRIIKTELMLDENIFFGPTIVHNDIAFHWSSLLAANNIGYTDKVVCTHRKFEVRPQLTSISDQRRLTAFSALNLTHSKILKHENKEHLIDNWVLFANNLMEWIKPLVPDDLQFKFEIKRKSFNKKIIFLKHENIGNV